jgi:CRP-like cAMP-binding protein
MVISDSDWKMIEASFEYQMVAKNHELTTQGKIENKLYFILEGMIHLYHDAGEKDVTLNIGFPGSFINCYTSFLTQTDSEFALKSLVKSSVVYITKEKLERLYISTSCGQELGRILTENLLLYLSKREDAFLLKSPTQRYLDLFEEQPQLIREIPQKYLASYIGITPQALSRIRRKL